MVFFKCLIRGEGFRGVIPDRSDLAGFYVNRPVEANEAESARAAVLARFREKLAALGWADGWRSTRSRRRTPRTPSELIEAASALVETRPDAWEGA